MRSPLRAIADELALDRADELRMQRIAFDAFKRGITATQLGSYTDDDWQLVRDRAKEPTASTLVCAGAADYVALLERRMP